MIVMMIVSDKTTNPQLNNIVQRLERCNVAICVGQRATDFWIAEKVPAHKRNCVKARLVQDRCKRLFAHNNLGFDGK
jgi:hypothetical protein